MKDMGMTQEVDGVTWKLMITDKGVTWKIQPKEGETPDEEQEANMKAAASINVADFSAPLKQPQINTEVSYSDLVPNNQRVLCRNQVIEEELDDPIFSSTNMEDRPPLKSDFRDGQQALFFHPQATKALRLRAQMKEEPPVKKSVDEKMVEEEEGLHVAAAALVEAVSPTAVSSGIGAKSPPEISASGSSLSSSLSTASS